jgi:C1A family cysteine protease
MRPYRRVQRYGWVRDLPDHRDRFYGLEEKVQRPAALAPTGGLTPDRLPPIWDQGNIGSCTAHGSLRVFLAEAIKQGLKLPMLSRLEQYYNSRLIEGNENSDSGAQVRDAIKALGTFGVAPESEWPYDTTRFADQPPARVYDESKQHMAFKYQRVQVGGPGAPMRTALAHGQAIAFGFPVPTTFEDGSWDPSTEEPLPLPGANTGTIGGHCVAATFYNFSGKFISTPSTSRRVRPYFTCDNSWSESWGMNGRFNLDAQWFTPDLQLASDLWVIQKVD